MSQASAVEIDGRPDALWTGRPPARNGVILFAVCLAALIINIDVTSP